MTPEEKAKFSERLLYDASKELRAQNIRVHKSSDFSEDGYSIMVSLFIPFSKYYLTDKRIHKFRLIIEGGY